MATVTQWSNEANHIRVQHFNGAFPGLVHHFPKKTMNIVQHNSNDITVSHGNIIHNYNYSEISTQAPAGHTSMATFVQIILGWCATDTTLTQDDSKDSYSRTRVSVPTTVFEEQFQHGLNMDKFNTYTHSGGSVSFVPGLNGIELKTDLTINSLAVLQTKQYMTYQQCKSTFIEITALARTTSAPSNSVRIGYFDDTNDKAPEADTGGNGVFLQVNGTNSFVMRTWDGTTQTDMVVPQNSWSLDPMDGGGFSGLVLDTTKINNYIFDLSSDGGARIRCGVKIKGAYIWCHEFCNGNSAVVPNLATMSLPIRVESKNTGNESAVTKLLSMGVVVEGGRADIGRAFSASRGFGQTQLTLNTAGESKVAFVLRLTGSRCRASLQPQQLKMYNSLPNSWFHYRVILNPQTINGGSWHSPTALSVAETCIDASSFVIGSGNVVASGYCAAEESVALHQFFRDVPMCSNISGSTTDVLLIAVDYIRTNAAIYCSMEWNEIN